ncbi:MAG: hypothetical protein GQE15_25155 [Archangiaceae bacterium]|nr:hypothetical protein [Archangiaceae bacterium]
MKALSFSCLLSLVACSGAMPVVDAGSPFDAGSYTPVESRQLGLNDVTYLFPLVADAGSPFPAPESMIPYPLFDRISTVPGDVVTDLRRLQLVALRFDVCDRAATGPCPETADGVIRLVLQPTFNDGTAEDVAFHAFYPVPRSEVPEVVDLFRALARLQDVPTASALKVNTALGTNALFTSTLVGFVRKYALASNIFRLTVFGQKTNQAALIWVFRGVERRGDQFVRIQIPGIQEIDQVTLLFSSTEFRTMPQANEPKGFARAMNASEFRMASPADQREALEAMAASDNPTLHTSDTIQCVTCHVTTTVMADRLSIANVSAGTLTSRYTSTQFDLTPLGDDSARFRTLRALGWIRSSPLVAQRTVNETANVIAEIETRFPPAR